MNKIVLPAFFILILHTCQNSPLYSQDFEVPVESRLLYFVNTDSTNRNQFLIPFIESELKGLRHNLDTSKRMFSRVSSLNFFLAASRQTEINILTIDRFNKNSREFISNPQSRNNTIVDRLISNDFFLRLNINILNNLIEYQFELLKLDPARTFRDTTTYPDPDILQYRATSFFIDPNSHDYKEKIRIGLRQIIKEANVAPKPNILINNRLINTPGFSAVYGVNVVYVEEGVPFEILASQFDEDSPDDLIKYRWWLMRNNQNLITKPFDKKQVITIDSADSYWLSLRVSDGINEDSVAMIVICQSKPFVNVIVSEIEDTNHLHREELHFYSFRSIYKKNDFIGTPFFPKDEQPIISVGSDPGNSRNINFYLVQDASIFDTTATRRDYLLGKDTLSKKYPYYFDTMRYKMQFHRYNDPRPYVGYLYFVKQNERYGNIKVPSTDLIKTEVSANNISNHTYFRMNYHKVPRINPTMTNSYIFGNGTNTLVAVGCNAIITSWLHLYGAVGVTYPLSDLKYIPPINDAFSTRFDAQVYLIKDYYTEISAGVTVLNSPNYQKGNLSAVTHDVKFGIGASFQKFSKYGPFKLHQPMPQFFFTIYPKSTLNTKLTFNTFELGFRITFFFIK